MLQDAVVLFQRIIDMKHAWLQGEFSLEQQHGQGQLQTLPPHSLSP